VPLLSLRLFDLMSFTPEQVLEALKKVKHPEKKQDIVDLIT